MAKRNRYFVLGVGIDVLVPSVAVATIERLALTGSKSYVVFCGPGNVLIARKEPRVKEAIEGATLVTADSMSLVWLGMLARRGPVARVYGPDIMLELFQATGGRLRHFFYGGAPGVAEEMVARLKRRFPELSVAGILPHEGAKREVQQASEAERRIMGRPVMLSPRDSNPDDIARINEAHADVLWVGLGHPKQELWMHANRAKLNTAVLAGVGAAFDYHSGRKREAPEWMKRSALQWLHRLAHEPRRLWREELVGKSIFFSLVLRELLSRQAPSDGGHQG